uniref:Uncharacterized protein n=1 Tax=Sinocyclocheilus anshuiensis TaxID=1608454 RepID=A0A671NBM0_9TELE
FRSNQRKNKRRKRIRVVRLTQTNRTVYAVCVQWILSKMIQQNHTGSSLVFCSAGRSRSPALIMAYLMRFEGLSLLQAHQRVLAARPFIQPNAGFWRQLLQYERKLTHSNSIRSTNSSFNIR